MRVFIYEYTCACEPDGSSLCTEGAAMLAALLSDFAALPATEVVTLRNSTATRDEAGPAGATCRWVRPEEEESAFRAEARAAAWTIVIAPEFDDLLRTRCAWVAEEGGRLLGPSLDAIALTADKLALGEHLRGAAVPVPPAVVLPCDVAPWLPAVCKPRFGAGSQATFLLRHADELPAVLSQAAAEGWTGPLILQPFLPGRAVSVAFLIGPRQRVPLLPAEQYLSMDGRFHYLGGRLPLPAELAERARGLADRAVAAVSGLGGYVGVDVLLGPAADGSGDAVIEINPRLTTSYLGLRALARDNLAGLLLRVAEAQEPIEAEWRRGVVEFTANGEVSVAGDGDACGLAGSR